MASNSTSSPQLFHCPTCGASLPVPDTATVRCEYCGSSVLVPAEYRSGREADWGGHAQQVSVRISSDVFEPSTSTGRNSLAGIIVFVVVAALVCIISGAVLSATGAFTLAGLFGGSTLNETFQNPASAPSPTFIIPTAAPSPTPISPVKVALLFGGQGSGPGKFDDPRYVAVDLDGNIFVANYQDGRLQKFDSQGNFLQLVNIQPDQNDYTIVRDMATDYRGNLYVARGGELLIYNVQDVSLTGSIPSQFPDLNQDKVVSDPANNLYVYNRASGMSGMLKYDPQGNVQWRNENILEDIVSRGKPSDATRIAVDGLGNLFILNRPGYEIYKFDSQGSFQDRFGSQGDQPQQFNNPDPMNVDPKGRVFVLDFDAGYVLKVFDNNGTYLKTLPWPKELTFPRMFVFDVQGNLYTVTNTSQVAMVTILPEALGD